MIDRDTLETAGRAVEARMREIDEEMATLAADVPGDPGLYRWPPYLEREFERLYTERELLRVQQRTLRRVGAQFLIGWVA